MPELDFSHMAAWTSPFPIFACKWAAFFFGLAVSVFLLASMLGWGGGEWGGGKGVITSMRMRLASSVSFLAPCRCGKRRKYCGLRCFFAKSNASSKFKAAFLKQIALTVMAMVRMMMMMIIIIIMMMISMVMMLLMMMMVMMMMMMMMLLITM